MSTVLFQLDGQRFWRRATVKSTDGEWLEVEYEVAKRLTAARVHLSKTVVDAPSDVRSGDEVLVESPTEPTVFWKGAIRTQRGDEIEVRVPGMGKAGRDAIWPAKVSGVRRLPLTLRPNTELAPSR